MTGFLIDLNPTCLSHPQDVDLAILEAAMFFPDDARRRDAYEHTSKIQFLLKYADVVDDPVGLAKTALHANSPIDFHDEAIDRGIKGLITGWILDQAIARSAAGNDPAARMKVIFAHASKRVSAVWQASPKTVEQAAWGKFKAVAHLWAARSAMEASGFILNTFPCARSDLPTFLGMAAKVRNAATTTSMKQSRWGTILLPQDAAWLPDDLNVPDVSLMIASRTEA
jgi:hypothetical protein